MQPRNTQIGFWAVVATVALLLSLGAGAVPLLDPDESRFARTSVEMMRDGDLVVPHFEGRPRIVKPPLLHWIQSALFRALGISERVARLPSAVATLASLLLVGWVARRRFGGEGALWAAAIFASMPLVFVVGKIGTLDALLAAHVLAVVALDMAAPGGGGPARGFVVGGLLGLGFLIKGPVAVVLPLVVVLAGRAACRREVLPRPAATLRALGGFSVVVLPWGLAFVHRLGVATVAGMIHKEVLARFYAGAAHAKPAWFYAVVLAVGTFPWAAPLALALGRLTLRRRDPSARTAIYAASGLVAGIVFFSMSRSKLANYILPLMPLAAIVLTWELGQELRAPRERTSGPLLILASLGVAGLGLWIAPFHGLDPRVGDFAPTGGAILIAGALATAVGAILRRPRWSWACGAATSAIFLATAFLVLAPRIATTRSSADLIREVPALAEPGRPVVTVDMKVPSLAFYLDRPIQEVSTAALPHRLDENDAPLFVFDEDDWRRLGATVRAELREIGHQGKYLVFEKAATRPGPPALDLPGAAE